MLQTHEFIQWPLENKRRVNTAPEIAKQLESFYSHTKLPSQRQRSELARRINMNPRKVQIWFQNRRAKEKKMTNKKIVKKPDNSSKTKQIQSKSEPKPVEIENKNNTSITSNASEVSPIPIKPKITQMEPKPRLIIEPKQYNVKSLLFTNRTYEESIFERFSIQPPNQHFANQLSLPPLNSS